MAHACGDPGALLAEERAESLATRRDGASACQAELLQPGSGTGVGGLSQGAYPAAH